MAVQYDEYLKSKDWAELREAALVRANRLCEHCHKPATHVHHVRYPKVGEPHSLDMLVAVCDRCHDLEHGAKDMNPLLDPKQTRLDGPYNNTVTVYHSDGVLWATIDQWVRVLQAPYFMPDYFTRHLDVWSMRLKGGRYSATCGGVKAYRWPPVAATLDKWYRDWMLKVVKGDTALMPMNLLADSKAFALKVEALKIWGWELQERELQAALKARMTPEQAESGIADTKQAMQVIEAFAHTTQVTLDHHDQRISATDQEIDQVKANVPAYRDPQEFIPVKQRCFELAYPPAIQVAGRLNLTAACGQYLKEKGAPQGPKLTERPDGSGLTYPVATWRRCDIDDALKRYMPTVDDPKQLDLLD